MNQITNADFHARTEIHRQALVISLGGQQNALGRVLYIEELARGRAIAPHHDFLVAPLLRLDAFADQSRDDMRGLEIEIIAGAVEIGGQQENRVEAVLLAIGLRLNQQHLLGQTIRRVGLFGIAIPEIVFFEGHGREFGIRAHRANGHELAHAHAPGLMHQLHAHHKIAIEKLGRMQSIGADAAHLRGKMHDDGVFRRDAMLLIRVIEQPTNRVHLGEIIIPLARDHDASRAAGAQRIHQKGAEKTGPPRHNHQFIRPGNRLLRCCTRFRRSQVRHHVGCSLIRSRRHARRPADMDEDDRRQETGQEPLRSPIPRPPSIFKAVMNRARAPPCKR